MASDRLKHVVSYFLNILISISKSITRQAEVAKGVPGRLRPRIFSTFGTTRVVGSQPNAPAAFTPGEILGTHFRRLSRPRGTWFCRKEPRKKSQVTPPEIDPGTVRLVAQRLNHYATPGPNDEHNRTIITVLAKHWITPWWWFLREPKHVRVTVWILIVLKFLWFYNCVQQLE